MYFSWNWHLISHNRKFLFTNEIIEIIRIMEIKSYDIDTYEQLFGELEEA